MSLFRKKSLEHLLAQAADSEKGLKRTLGATNLVALGIGAIIGAGLFVDNEVGAATATGLGEAIIRVAGSAIVVELMRNGMKPSEACREVVLRIIRKNKDLTGLQCGFIAMDKQGNVGGFSVYNGFNFGVYVV